jgi:AraC family transcriptional regulator of adaptative response/methylated-DNA-[protein]-cysteine methyltransferase
MTHYERIAAVIRYLDGHHVEQPDLATLSEYVGLSPHHFHRLFSKWAGITPKDFLQCLTLAHARQLLLKGESVLDAALATGLSGPGRLHDLCVTLDAASPGEVKSGGAGWTLTYGFVPSPFGHCLIAESPRGLCHLSFLSDRSETAATTRLLDDWPSAHLHRDDMAVATFGRRIFSKTAFTSPALPLRVFVAGTDFQVRVWRALLQIPPGQVATYGRLAAAIGRPAATRAVGTAVGRNPLAWLIPCHRVIRQTGALGGYRWGTVRKRAMLVWESCPPETTPAI